MPKIIEIFDDKFWALMIILSSIGIIAGIFGYISGESPSWFSYMVAEISIIFMCGIRILEKKETKENVK